MMYNLQKYSNRFKNKISKSYTLNWRLIIYQNDVKSSKILFRQRKHDPNSKKQKSSISLKYLSLIEVWLSKFQNGVQSSEIFKSIQILDPNSKKQKSLNFLKYLSASIEAFKISQWCTIFKNSLSITETRSKFQEVKIFNFLKISFSINWSLAFKISKWCTIFKNSLSTTEARSKFQENLRIPENSLQRGLAPLKIPNLKALLLGFQKKGKITLTQRVAKEPASHQPLHHSRAAIQKSSSDKNGNRIVH